MPLSQLSIPAVERRMWGRAEAASTWVSMQQLPADLGEGQQGDWYLEHMTGLGLEEVGFAGVNLLNQLSSCQLWPLAGLLKAAVGHLYSLWVAAQALSHYLFLGRFPFGWICC